MPYLLQVDFPIPGPFGAAMVQAFTDLAHSINQEPGMRWKIWTENAQAQEAGGVYLFDTQEQAQAVEVVAFNDEVAVRGEALGGVAVLRHNGREHHIGIQRLVVRDGIALPIQAQLLAREVFSQQAAQFGGAEGVQLLEQGGGSQRHRGSVARE